MLKDYKKIVKKIKKIFDEHRVAVLCNARLKVLQRSGVQLSEKLASFGIMGAELGPP